MKRNLNEYVADDKKVLRFLPCGFFNRNPSK
jgi:hypothetical protein